MRNIGKATCLIIVKTICLIMCKTNYTIEFQIVCLIIEQIACLITEKIACSHKYYKKKNHIQKECDTVKLNMNLQKLDIPARRYISNGQRIRKDELLNQYYDKYTSKYDKVIDDYLKSEFLLDRKICDDITYLKEGVSKFKHLKDIFEGEHAYYYAKQKVNDIESDLEELRERIRKMSE